MFGLTFLDNHLISFFFLLDNLTGNIYLELLEDIIDPTLINIIENDEHYLEDQLVFQQDGTPPHYAQYVCEYLDQTFPDRWIERRGAIEWLPRSPDLSSLDFFLSLKK